MLFSIPEPLPLDGVDAQTGIRCPSCYGTLVMRLRKEHAAFQCRIDHAFSLPEVVATMEDTLERRLWDAVASMEELADFLEIASRLRLAQVERESFQDRSRLLREHAQQFRLVISGERPLRTNDAANDVADGS